jgi:hypothetical protein
MDKEIMELKEAGVQFDEKNVKFDQDDEPIVPYQEQINGNMVNFLAYRDNVYVNIDDLHLLASPQVIH